MLSLTAKTSSAARATALGQAVEPHRHAGAAAIGALGDDLAAVRLRDLAHDREAEPGARQPAGGRRAVEAVEHVREVRLVDPWAVVADDNLAALDLHLDLAAGWAPLRRVVEQVRDRALDRRRDASDERLLELGREQHAGAIAARALDGVGGDEVEPHVLRLLGELLAACE